MAETPIRIASQPGVMRDSTRFDTDQHVDALWCRWAVGKPQKMGGYREVTSSVPEVSRGLHGFYSDGFSYLHSGGETKIVQANSFFGTGSGFTDRTPTLMQSSVNNHWTFAVRYDPFLSNRPMLMAHGAQNLERIDSAVETPVFWGDAAGTDPLTPMAIPPTNTSFTVLATTGDTASTTAVTAIASTATLSKGMMVSGSGIPANTYIASVDSGTAITLSQSATSSLTGTALTFTVGGVSGGIFTLHPYVMHYGSNGKVGWSTNANPNDFWGTGSGEAYVTSQKIVRGMPMRGGPGNSPSGLLWSLDSLIRVSFAGGDATFGFDEQSNSISVLSPQSIVEADGSFFWAGVDRFFMYSGTVRELPNPFNSQWFFDNMNTAQKQKCFAFRNTRWGEIWFCAPLFGATECSHAVIYNMRDNCWYDTALPNGGRSAAIAPVVDAFPYMMGVEEGDDGYTLWQHESGRDEVHGPNTYAIRSYYETSDITLLTQQQAKNESLHVAVIEPDFVQTGDLTVTVVGNYNARSPTQTSAVHTIKAEPAIDEQVVKVKETRRQMRFRFESNTAGGHYEAGKILAHIAPADDKRISG